MLFVILLWICGLTSFQSFYHKHVSFLRRSTSEGKYTFRYLNKQDELYSSLENTNIFHLNEENLEKLEKLFYLKNSRYSPYKNKYTNHSVVNVTRGFDEAYKEGVILNGFVISWPNIYGLNVLL